MAFGQLVFDSQSLTMERYSTSPSPLQTARETFFNISWSNVSAAVLLVCIATRIVSGLQSRRREPSSSNSQAVRLAPYWVPWIGHAPAFLWNHVTFFTGMRNSLCEPVFDIYLRGVKYHAVTSPSMMKAVLSVKAATPNNQMLDQALRNVFGDRSLIQNLGLDRNYSLNDRAASVFNEEVFVAEASSTIIRLVQRDMPNLVSFCRSIVDQNPWERGTSGVEVPDEINQTVCEANLFALMSNFIGHIMSTFLMGDTFVENFPNLSEDLGRLDECFVTLFIGTPRWVPHPAASAGHAASGRLRHIMSVFHRALTAWDDGIDAGIELRDLENVSELVKDRMRTFRKLGLSHHASAAGHLSLYYDLIAYTTKITFWMTTHLFADPALLSQVRKEIAPYVVASRPSRQETGFPFDEPPRLSVDIDQVLTLCPLFKACYYEAVRLHSAGISVKKLVSDVTLSESAEEAAYGSTKPRTYKIPKGENIVLPHGAYHHDARYFSNPEQYDPLRFLVVDPATGAQRADPSILAPFADGLYGSSNNGFAERAILTFTAGIIALWEIEPTSGEFLSVPGHKMSWGAFRPTKELRVKMQQRV